MGSCAMRCRWRIRLPRGNTASSCTTTGREAGRRTWNYEGCRSFPPVAKKLDVIETRVACQGSLRVEGQGLQEDTDYTLLFRSLRDASADYATHLRGHDGRQRELRADVHRAESAGRHGAVLLDGEDLYDDFYFEGCDGGGSPEGASLHARFDAGQCGEVVLEGSGYRVSAPYVLQITYPDGGRTDSFDIGSTSAGTSACRCGSSKATRSAPTPSGWPSPRAARCSPRRRLTGKGAGRFLPMRRRSRC